MRLLDVRCTVGTVRVLDIRCRVGSVRVLDVRCTVGSVHVMDVRCTVGSVRVLPACILNLLYACWLPCLVRHSGSISSPHSGYTILIWASVSYR